jgi:hypothetical protein
MSRKRKKGLGRRFGEWLVVNRRLTAAERIGNRMGYMGSAFIMMSPYLLPYDNIVWLAKQWNLVTINVNLLIGYGLYIFG